MVFDLDFKKNVYGVRNRNANVGFMKIIISGNRMDQI